MFDNQIWLGTMDLNSHVDRQAGGYKNGSRCKCLKYGADGAYIRSLIQFMI